MPPIIACDTGWNIQREGLGPAIKLDKGQINILGLVSHLTLGEVNHPKEMLEPFGLNAKDPKFWQSGLDVIKSYVEMV